MGESDKYITMKNILLIIWMIPIYLNAGTYDEILKEKQSYNKNAQLYTNVIMVTAVICNGLGDGFNNRGNVTDGYNHKPIGHTLNAISIGLTAAAFYYACKNGGVFWKNGLKYMLFRIALFDYAYNAGAQLPYDYAGFTSNYDKTFNRVPHSGIAMMRGVSMIVGFRIPIK